MYALKTSLLILMLLFLLIGCESDYKLDLKSPKKIQINQELTLKVEEKNNKTIDSLQFYINQEKISTSQNLTSTIDIKNYRLGKHALKAIVFYEGKSKEITKEIYFLADTEPEIYEYEIINTYPHDKNSYTQGLEFYNGFLYESSGQYGKSSLRKVKLETGEVLQRINLDQKYFGEGLTIFNQKIYQLTWKEGVGFIYDLENFTLEKNFPYQKSVEGWGLTHDENHLIKTDGTERIWFLNPENQKEEYFIEAYTNKRKVEQLNELEYINGKIYANIYQQNSILIVDPKNGKVEGVANLNGLKNLVEQHADLDVLNGIAYDKKTDRLFVTGKNWSKLFEIKLKKKP
ncbi:MAG: glutaminyl-peptide cyclotransferase [Flavobacteriaceae bacterium]|nr:glutaminyl-peptide cyclotransferase [Flavobacteriaceae bacterium]